MHRLIAGCTRGGAPDTQHLNQLMVERVTSFIEEGVGGKRLEMHARTGWCFKVLRLIR